MKFRSYYFILTNSKSHKAEVRGRDTVTECNWFKLVHQIKHHRLTLNTNTLMMMMMMMISKQFIIKYKMLLIPSRWQHFPNTRICFFQPSNQISGSKYPDHSNQTTKSESDSSNQLQSCLRGLILVGTFLRCSKAWRQTELHWEQNYFNLNPNVW